MRKRQIFVAAAVALFLGAPLIVRGEQEMAAGKEQEKTILDGIYLERCRSVGNDPRRSGRGGRPQDEGNYRLSDQIVDG